MKKRYRYVEYTMGFEGTGVSWTHRCEDMGVIRYEYRKLLQRPAAKQGKKRYLMRRVVYESDIIGTRARTTRTNVDRARKEAKERTLSGRAPISTILR